MPLIILVYLPEDAAQTVAAKHRVVVRFEEVVSAAWLVNRVKSGGRCPCRKATGSTLSRVLPLELQETLILLTRGCRFTPTMLVNICFFDSWLRNWGSNTHIADGAVASIESTIVEPGVKRL